MSKFSTYAREVDEIAKAAFKEYVDAEEKLKNAEAAAKQYVYRSRTDAQYELKRARAQADLLEAREAKKKAELNLQNQNAKIASIRSALEMEVGNVYAADPSALDTPTLELLKSGILNANEYARLMDKAKGNHTMCRIIAKYAKDAAIEAGKKYGDHDGRVLELKGISNRADNFNGNEVLDMFDVLEQAYRMTANNPAMIGSWDELTANAMNNL